MTTPYKTIPAYSVTWDGATWTQTPTQGADFWLMSFDEALFSLRVQGNAYVDGAVCLALRQALGVVPDAAGVGA
jgi:hypothetical protein